MITRQLHPLDQVKLIGDSQHGLMAAGGEWLRVGEKLFPLRTADYGYKSVYAGMRGDTHLLRVPGVAQIALTSDQLEAEAALGHAWQNYTLLSGLGLCVHGKIVGAPIYIDAAAAPWLVNGAKTLGNVTYGAPFSATLTISPYGRIGEEPAPGRVVTVSLPATGLGLPSTLPSHLTGVTTFILELQSISSTGAEVVYALIPRFGRYPWEYTYGKPAAFWRLVMSGVGEDVTAQVSVLRTLAQSVGSRLEAATGPQTVVPEFEFEAAHAVEGPPDAHDFQWSTLTLTGVTCSQPPSTRRVGVEGQLLAVLHDDENLLVELSVDVVYEERRWLEDLTWSIDRPHRCQFGPPHYNYAYNEEKSRLTLGFRLGHETKYRVRLLRDGMQVDETLITATTLSDWQDTEARPPGSLQQKFKPGSQAGKSWDAVWTGQSSITRVGHHYWSQSITGQSSQWAADEGIDRVGDTFVQMQSQMERFTSESGYGVRPMKAYEAVRSAAPFVYLPSVSPSNFTASPRQYTNNVYGLVIDITPPSDGVNPWQLTPYVPTTVVAPRALKTIPAAIDNGTTAELFASYHPLTHDIYAGYVGREHWMQAPGLDITLLGVNWI